MIIFLYKYKLKVPQNILIKNNKILTSCYNFILKIIYIKLYIILLKYIYIFKTTTKQNENIKKNQNFNLSKNKKNVVEMGELAVRVFNSVTANQNKENGLYLVIPNKPNEFYFFKTAVYKHG